MTKRYAKNYLSQVLFKIDFDSNEQINDESLRSYKTNLGTEYSSLSNIVQQGIVIQGNSSGMTAEQNTNTVWRIDSKEGKHFLEVQNNCLVLACTEYSHFTDFQNLINHTLDVFFSVFEDINTIQRVGLRYINQIKIGKEFDEWGQYVNPSLVEHLKFVEPDKIRRSMHTMYVEHDEETNLKINFGIFNKFFPAPIVEDEKEFVFDIDAFTTTNNEKKEVSELVNKFNRVITEYFERGITDSLRSKMEEIK